MKKIIVAVLFVLVISSASFVIVNAEKEINVHQANMDLIIEELVLERNQEIVKRVQLEFELQEQIWENERLMEELKQERRKQEDLESQKFLERVKKRFSIM